MRFGPVLYLMLSRIFITLRNFHFGGIASKESVLQLTKGKCMTILLDYLEIFPLKKSDFRSLDFVSDCHHFL